MRVRAVEVTRPPTTTTASGRWTSEPGPLAKSMGKRPKAAMLAVIKTGRNRRFAPSTTTSPKAMPASSNWLKYVTITTPFKTAIPNRAIKPTEAGTDKYSPANNKPKTPPTKAKGILAKTNTAWRTEPKVENNRQKISPNATGTTIAKRAAARCWFSNCPPHVK